LPPACAAAGLAALRIIERDARPRERVMALAERVRRELTGIGFDCGASATPIVPVIMGDSKRALEAAEFLRERGFFVPAIRPPTVPPNGSRLRLNLMSTHTDEQIEQLLRAFGALRERNPM